MPTDPGNVPSATALSEEPYRLPAGGEPPPTFKEWWLLHRREIDALRARERRLREYVTHKPECALLIYCDACSARDTEPHLIHGPIAAFDADPEQSGCTCKLAELLAAKEGLNV